jgi:hypothetical protein
MNPPEAREPTPSPDLPPAVALPERPTTAQLVEYWKARALRAEPVATGLLLYARKDRVTDADRDAIATRCAAWATRVAQEQVSP